MEFLGWGAREVGVTSQTVISKNAHALKVPLQWPRGTGQPLCQHRTERPEHFRKKKKKNRYSNIQWETKLHVFMEF